MDFVQQHLINKLEEIIDEYGYKIILIPYGSRTKNTSILGSDLECAVLITEVDFNRDVVIENFNNNIKSLNIDFYKSFD